MQMESTTLLIREKRLNPKSFGYHLNNPGLKAHALAGCHDGGKLA
jgi:hypothetical protein